MVVVVRIVGTYYVLMKNEHTHHTQIRMRRISRHFKVEHNKLQWAIEMT